MITIRRVHVDEVELGHVVVTEPDRGDATVRPGGEWG
jgi:hypothetical protein